MVSSEIVRFVGQVSHCGIASRMEQNIISQAKRERTLFLHSLSAIQQQGEQHEKSGFNDI